MSKIPLYIPDPLPGVELAYWFAPHSPHKLFTEALPPNFFETDIERVRDPKQARAIVLANNFKELRAESRAYLKTYADLGESLRVPVLAFSLGDMTDRVQFDARVYVLRLSVYKSRIGKRDIVIPTIIEDAHSFLPRKKQEIPVVSFCGMAALSTKKAWIKYWIKNSLYDLFSLLYPKIQARKIGVYWRRAMMHACTASKLVSTRFIVRSSFSGNKKTIELDPAIARREFLDSLLESDFVLAPKGDGNYSNRFLEALAHGRIPVLLDTDVALPLEDQVSYEDIIIRVPMHAVDETPVYISRFYKAMDEKEYLRRQKLAQEIFQKFLRSDAFFRNLFVQLP